MKLERVSRSERRKKNRKENESCLMYQTMKPSKMGKGREKVIHIHTFISTLVSPLEHLQTYPL